MKTTGNLTNVAAHFVNGDQTIAFLESLRWPNGAACPHRGGRAPCRIVAEKSGTRTRRGLWKCSQGGIQFTVKIGTIFEQWHIPVSNWLMASALLCASKKGMSADQFMRMLGMTYRSAWFMARRLRHAMAEDGSFELMTGVVEADETYVGARCKRGAKRGRPGPGSHKASVFALVQRGGKVRVFPADRVISDNLRTAPRAKVDPSATLMTDEFPIYTTLGMEFAKHDTVDHRKDEYVRGTAHVNAAEGFFSLLKRGITGVYHHVSMGHLHRYCDEFAFRCNNRMALGVSDGDRAPNLSGAEGKRLTFEQPIKRKRVRNGNVWARAGDGTPAGVERGDSNSARPGLHQSRPAPARPYDNNRQLPLPFASEHNVPCSATTRADMTDEQPRDEDVVVWESDSRDYNLHSGLARQ